MRRFQLTRVPNSGPDAEENSGIGDGAILHNNTKITFYTGRLCPARLTFRVPISIEFPAVGHQQHFEVIHVQRLVHRRPRP